VAFDTDSGEAAGGEANYPGKEQWKNDPGNRYTPAELQEMERSWEVHIFNPDKPQSRSAD